MLFICSAGDADVGVAIPGSWGWILETTKNHRVCALPGTVSVCTDDPPIRLFPLQVPSPTTSPGRRPRSSKGQDGFFAGDGPNTDALAVADAVAAEVGCEGLDRETLRPFEPVALEDVSEMGEKCDLNSFTVTKERHTL